MSYVGNHLARTQAVRAPKPSSDLLGRRVIRNKARHAPKNASPNAGGKPDETLTHIDVRRSLVTSEFDCQPYVLFLSGSTPYSPDASLTCVWVRKNEEADSVQTDSLHSASRASRKAPHPLLRFSSQNRNDVSVLKGRAAKRTSPRVYTGKSDAELVRTRARSF